MSAARRSDRTDQPWLDGTVATPVGAVPRLRTAWSRADRYGAWKVRWNLGRRRYAMPPGLYAVGTPEADSPVFVTANYKLSVDHLRRALAGLDGWVLVLDTQGINVWCAAGKGTFGTAELVARLTAVRLAEVVRQRTLILPQLGAVGIAAHEVKQQSGFAVVYGPVRAADLPAFLAAGCQATPDMRRVRFGFADRLAVVPVDLVLGAPYALSLAVVLALSGGLGVGTWRAAAILDRGARAALLAGLAFLAGAVLTPALLPWLPGRAFAVKGAVVGLLLFLAAWASGAIPVLGCGAVLQALPWMLLLPATTAFVALNFTGSTTYTSLSGVRREMRLALPWIALAGLGGLTLWLAL
jgi:acetyl-CoA decarbonylase/synthase complex subunit gamma